jgi:amino acid transporter
MNTTNKAASENGILGFTELWALGVGQVIGAGVITLIGPAIGLTGYSVWLAYFVAVLLGAATNLPLIIFSSVTKYSGGDYSIITMLGGEKIGGMFIVSFILQMLGMSLYVTAIGLYTESLFPAINGKMAGLALLVLFYIVNMFGVANMAKFQKTMSALLVAVLLMFGIAGLIKGNFSSSMAVASGRFFSNGFTGFWSAAMLLIYSCQGYKLTVMYGGQAKNPTKNMPRALLAVIPVILVVYTLVALIDVSVLPLDKVVNKPLTLAAKEILPSALFVLFIIGGPIMALLTTLNSTYGAMVGPFAKAAKDGWFPAALAKKNKYGAAVVILTIELIIGVIPVLLNFSVATIVNNLMLITSVYQFLLYYSLLQVPRKMPQKWSQATMHCNNAVYYGIIAVASLFQLFILYKSIRNLTPVVAITNVAVLLICFIYAVVRHNLGKTHIDTEGMLELTDAYAKKA